LEKKIYKKENAKTKKINMEKERNILKKHHNALKNKLRSN